MTKEIKDTILDALSQYEGDDYDRAKHAFKGLTISQMKEQYGQSGNTRQEVLDGYARHAGKVAKARRFINNFHDVTNLSI